MLEDRNAEDEATRDYVGRCILELLQNADDAMALAGATPAELIGAKGLGFKSVPEVTDNPQIFSVPSASRSMSCARARCSPANRASWTETGRRQLGARRRHAGA